MSLYPKFRDVHLWVGLILLIPLVAIAATGVLLNHERLVGLKPGYNKPKESETQEKQPKRESTPAASSLTVVPGQWNASAGAIDSAVAAAAAEWGQKDVNLERIELKSEPGYGLVVKVKAAKSTGLRPEEFVWSVADQAIVKREGDPQAGIAWHKVVHDLHTGAIFSHDYGFFWSDLAGISIVLLGATGVVLYAIPLMKKAAKKKNKAVPAAARPAVARAAKSPALEAAPVAVESAPAGSAG